MSPSIRRVESCHGRPVAACVVWSITSDSLSKRIMSPSGETNINYTMFYLASSYDERSAIANYEIYMVSRKIDMPGFHKTRDKNTRIQAHSIYISYDTSFFLVVSHSLTAWLHM